jgi:Phosphotransferase enzyme family
VSAHASFRRELEVVADTAGLSRALWSATDHEWLDPQRGWHQTFGRFDPGAEVFAHLVLETAAPQDQEIVIAEVSRSARPGAGAGQAVVPDLGWVRLSHPDDDPALPTLKDVRSDLGSHDVVRYRPGRRCTIKVDGPRGTRWLKVFADDRGAQLYSEQVAIAAERRRGALTFRVAEPLLLDADRRAIWLGDVAGSPVVHRLLRPGGEHLAHRMGQALASIGQSDLAPDSEIGADDLLRRSLRGGRELASRVPALTGDVERLLAWLTTTHDRIDGRAHRPIHGAPHPNQWLDDDGALGLVDFDGVAMGDPELDVATFQAEVDFETGPEAARAAVNQAFEKGYESLAGPLNRPLLLAYRAHKRLAKAVRTARAVRPDGDVRAARHLAMAMSDTSVR